jgi:hypothetical protein
VNFLKLIASLNDNKTKKQFKTNKIQHKNI